ncbi:hypothetical protein GC173_18210 [bacterium]|nr:hypothetical protein [bacterium]
MSVGPIATHPDLQMIVVGRCGEGQLLTGWHEREADGRSGLPFRASGPDASLVLRVRQEATRLNLLVSGPVGIAGRPVDARIIFNNRKFEMPVGIDHWVYRSFPLEVHRPLLQVRIQVASPVIPDLVLANGDPRKLGVFLSAIWSE